MAWLLSKGDYICTDGKRKNSSHPITERTQITSTEQKILKSTPRIFASLTYRWITKAVQMAPARKHHNSDLEQDPGMKMRIATPPAPLCKTSFLAVKTFVLKTRLSSDFPLPSKNMLLETEQDHTQTQNANAQLQHSCLRHSTLHLN